TSSKRDWSSDVCSSDRENIQEEKEPEDEPVRSEHARERSLEIAEAEEEPQQIEYESEDFTDTVAPVESSDDSEVEEFDDDELRQLKQYELPSISILDDVEVSEKMD